METTTLTPKVKRTELQSRIQSLTAEVVKLTSELNTANTLKESYYKTKVALEDEVEQLHGLLDGLEGAGSRKTSHEDSWMRKDINAMTRLATLLASKVFNTKEQ